MPRKTSIFGKAPSNSRHLSPPLRRPKLSTMGTFGKGRRSRRVGCRSNRDICTSPSRKLREILQSSSVTEIRSTATAVVFSGTLTIALFVEVITMNVQEGEESNPSNAVRLDTPKAPDQPCLNRTTAPANRTGDFTSGEHKCPHQRRDKTKMASGSERRGAAH